VSPPARYPTIEAHRKYGGNPDIDIAFQYLKYYFEPDDKKLKKIEEDYRSGKLLTGELKQIAIEKITKFILKHQEKREKAKGVYYNEATAAEVSRRIALPSEIDPDKSKAELKDGRLRVVLPKLKSQECNVCLEMPNFLANFS